MKPAGRASLAAIVAFTTFASGCGEEPASIFKTKDASLKTPSKSSETSPGDVIDYGIGKRPLEIKNRKTARAQGRIIRPQEGRTTITVDDCTRLSALCQPLIHANKP